MLNLERVGLIGCFFIPALWPGLQRRTNTLFVETVIHGLPRGKVGWQIPPGTAAFDQIQDGANQELYSFIRRSHSKNTPAFSSNNL
jgi:hypothetical protein